jgi:hypothetical protein
MCTVPSLVVLVDVIIVNMGIVSEMNGLLQNVYWIIML